MTVDFIEEERRRNRLPFQRFRFQFTLRTLLLGVTLFSVLLGLSMASGTYFCSVALDGYIYGFPFPALMLNRYSSGPSLSFYAVPLLGNIVVFLLVWLGATRLINWIAGRKTLARQSRYSQHQFTSASTNTWMVNKKRGVVMAKALRLEGGSAILEAGVEVVCALSSSPNRRAPKARRAPPRRVLAGCVLREYSISPIRRSSETDRDFLPCPHSSCAAEIRRYRLDVAVTPFDGDFYSYLPPTEATVPPAQVSGDLRFRQNWHSGCFAIRTSMLSASSTALPQQEPSCRTCGVALGANVAQTSLMALEFYAQQSGNNQPRQWAIAVGPLCEDCAEGLTGRGFG
jgi:hypothetical protein